MSRRQRRIPVLYKDQDILVCEKAAGIPVQSDRSGNVDLISLLKNMLFMEQEGEEEPYLAPVHRLDRPVGGLMVFARNKKAAGELGRMIREGEFEKNYQAIVCGSFSEECGRLEDYLLKDGKANVTRIVTKDTPGAKYACLDYDLIDMIEKDGKVYSWLLVSLHTGRHHQIRVQFAGAGHPLYGDAKYNEDFRHGRKKCFPGLYATRLAFNHPGTGERMVFKTEPVGEAFEMMDVEAF